MHHYDIAAKVLVETCRDELIRQFIGIDVRESTVIEKLQQETVSVKTSDFPVRITDAGRNSRLVILEFQTEWRRYIALNLLDYRTRYLLKEDIGIISCVVLLRPSAAATELYEDEEVRFRYRLVKVYDMDEQSVVENGPICLLPFVPLMKNGAELCEQADNLIYASEKTKVEKADMLTSMAILSGLISKELPKALISRRRDIMIESAAYDIIKDEGRKEGMKEGRKEGMVNTVKLLLKLNFGDEAAKLHGKLQNIKNTAMLEAIVEVIHLAETLDDVVRFMDTEL